MSKTADIETAIMMSLDRGGRVTLEELEQRLYRQYPELAGTERSWIGIAVYRLIDDGNLRPVGCSHDRHDGGCVMEVVG